MAGAEHMAIVGRGRQFKQRVCAAQTKQTRAALRAGRQSLRQRLRQLVDRLRIESAALRRAPRAPIERTSHVLRPRIQRVVARELQCWYRLVESGRKEQWARWQRIMADVDYSSSRAVTLLVLVNYMYYSYKCLSYPLI